MFTARGVIFSIVSLSIWYIAKLPVVLKSLLSLTGDESLDTGKTGQPNIGLDEDARKKRPRTCAQALGYQLGLLMNTVKRVGSLACIVACLVGLFGNRANAQTLAKIARQSDVIYGRKNGVALTMEVFMPASRNGLGVIWIVSSNGISSREQTFQETFELRISPLLKRGFTVFAVIHGSAPIFNVQDMVSDIRRAVRFVRYHAVDFGIDGQRLGISGSSSGGLLALVVAMKGEEGKPTADDVVERVSSRVQAVGCFFPPTDLINFGASSQNIVDFMLEQGGNVDPSFQFYDLDTKTGARKPLTAREDIVRMLREMSPITHVTTDDPPTILIHGDQDRVIPVGQSQSLVARLNEAKVPARLVVRDGVGHAYPGWEADTKLITDWFDEHLHRVR
jgi:acetyl esterase/lipase